ncbi:unnamed protein product [Lupinus luteus]|uniref:ER lumen protein-retaining receptor n=1 Tax=Lupinus luteus TaxID=3873 RepID=A0AAV1W5T7_LUPLU
MNIFRLSGDITHLASVLVLLLKIHTIKSCAGISLKTQELYALVFASRYLDIFTNYISLYNTTMKLIFLGSSFSIVWYMRYQKIVRRTYDKDQDTFRHYILILPCLLLALVINERFTFREVMWAFSLYLEAVAILPQLVLLQRTRNIDNLTGQYVFLLGAYRALYILNWIYRYFTEPHFIHWISMILSFLMFYGYYCFILFCLLITTCPLHLSIYLSCHRKFRVSSSIKKIDPTRIGNHMYFLTSYKGKSKQNLFDMLYCSMDFWPCSNTALCRLFLLLYPKVSRLIFTSILCNSVFLIASFDPCNWSHIVGLRLGHYCRIPHSYDFFDI